MQKIHPLFSLRILNLITSVVPIPCGMSLENDDCLTLQGLLQALAK
jgi:hypothetical protein